MARTDPRNRTRYWTDDQLAGLSCLHADFTAHDYAPHSHDGFVIAATEAGGAEFTSRGAVGEAKPAVLLVFNPAEPHAGRMGRSRRWRYRSIYLSDAAIGDVVRALGLEAPPYFTANMVGDADLIADFLALHQTLDRGRDALSRRERLVGAFGRLFSRHGSGGRRIEAAPRDRHRLARVIEMMQDRHAESLGLDELGAAVGLTPFQLIGLFKRETGLTPHAYLVQIRLKAAMEALATGVPIAAAATSAGFYDQSALTRHLKQCHGVTPLQFAQGARNFRQ
jgi:AraC-like DNA-binding protein